MSAANYLIKGVIGSVFVLPLTTFVIAIVRNEPFIVMKAMKVLSWDLIFLFTGFYFLSLGVFGYIMGKAMDLYDEVEKATAKNSIADP